MGSAESLASVVAIILAEKTRPAVVVSALSGVTNDLLAVTEATLAGQTGKLQKTLAALAERHAATVAATIPDPKIAAEVNRYHADTLDTLTQFLRAVGEIGEFSARSRDTVLAVGERLSARLLAGILSARGHPAQLLDLEKAVPEKFAEADRKFYAFTEKEFARRARALLQKGVIPVATGYFGRVPGGMLAAVGRGYSDFCAALLAAGLGSPRLEIWTDVSGILTADPRKVKAARILPRIAAPAAAELAHFGAKVIHPQSLHPAIRAEIPVWIKNTFAPHDRGTEILPTLPAGSAAGFTAITCKKEITVVNIESYRKLLQYGFLARVFEVFARHKIAIDVVSTSEIAVSLAVPAGFKLAPLTAELAPVAKISTLPGQAIVCLVGTNLAARVGLAGQVFGRLAATKIPVTQISYGATGSNATFVVPEALADRAVAVLHAEFFE